MTARDRRALLVGGSVLFASVLLLRVVPWTVRQVVSFRTRAIERTATLVRARDLAAGLPASRDSLRGALAAIVGLAPQLVDGSTSAEAQASLSGLVSLAAARHSLKVLRLDPINDSAAGVFHRVGLHVECEGDVAGLAALLRSLETGAPLLSVPDLSVQALDPWGDPKVAERLHIELTIAGWYLLREGS